MPSFLSPLLLSVPLMLTGCSWWKSDQRDFLSFRWLSWGQLVLLLADRTPICAPRLSTAINEHVIVHCAINPCVNKHWSCSRVAKEAITFITVSKFPIRSTSKGVSSPTIQKIEIIQKCIQFTCSLFSPNTTTCPYQDQRLEYLSDLRNRWRNSLTNAKSTQSGSSYSLLLFSGTVSTSDLAFQRTGRLKSYENYVDCWNW